MPSPRVPLGLSAALEQHAGAPFQQELEAADAKHRESLAVHLRGVDKVRLECSS